MTIAGFGVIDGGCVALLILYFVFITKDWEPWYIMCVCLQTWVLLGMFWLPESPDYLYAKGRYTECKEVLLKMAKINGNDVDIE